MNKAYLILGGNIGNKLKNLEQARDLISEHAGTITKVSAIFVTAPWGNTDQPDFYNQALCIETKLSARELLAELLKIEASAGRIRDGKKWAERSIDIDILFYNDEIIDEPHLRIPHPHLAERRFVLAPLSQIAGDHIHPESHKSIDTLLQECQDVSEIKLLESTY